MSADKIKIDVTRFRNLLQKSENSSNFKKLLSELEYQNLLDLERKLIAHYYFENQENYLNLFKDYMDKELSMEEFKLIFLQVWMIDKAQSERALKKLLNNDDVDELVIDRKAENFANLLNRIFENCSYLDPVDVFFNCDFYKDYPSLDPADFFFKLDYRMSPVKFYPLDQDKKGEVFETVVTDLIHQIINY